MANITQKKKKQTNKQKIKRLLSQFKLGCNYKLFLQSHLVSVCFLINSSTQLITVLSVMFVFFISFLPVNIVKPVLTFCRVRSQDFCFVHVNLSFKVGYTAYIMPLRLGQMWKLMPQGSGSGWFSFYPLFFTKIWSWTIHSTHYYFNILNPDTELKSW